MVTSSQQKYKSLTGLVSNHNTWHDVPTGQDPRLPEGARNDFCHQTLAKWRHAPASSTHSKPGLYVSDVKANVYLLCNMHLVFSEENRRAVSEKAWSVAAFPIMKPVVCCQLAQAHPTSRIQSNHTPQPVRYPLLISSLLSHYKGGQLPLNKTMAVCDPCSTVFEWAPHWLQDSWNCTRLSSQIENSPAQTAPITNKIKEWRK